MLHLSSNKRVAAEKDSSEFGRMEAAVPSGARPPRRRDPLAASETQTANKLLLPIKPSRADRCTRSSVRGRHFAGVQGEGVGSPIF